MIGLASAVVVGYYVARPPAIYDRASVGRVAVYSGTIEETTARCGVGPVLGCSPIGGATDASGRRWCWIYAASGPQHAEIVRHERAHCAGWPAHHPGEIR